MLIAQVLGLMLQVFYVNGISNDFRCNASFQTTLQYLDSYDFFVYKMRSDD